MQNTKPIIAILVLVTMLFSCTKEKKIYTEKDLRSAVYTEDLETIQKGLDQGIDIDSKDSMGDTMLTIAIVPSRSTEIVAYLLEQGADPQDLLTFTPTKQGILTYTSSINLDLSYLSPDKTKLLLQYGADPNSFGDSEVSTLMKYVGFLNFEKEHGTKIEYKNVLASMELILKAGADPNFRGEKSGLSALSVALTYDFRDAVDLLLKYGAKPSAKPIRLDYNYDPLNYKEYDENYGVTWQSDTYLYAANGYTDLLMPYIKSGEINPYTKTPNGWDYFFYAVRGGHPEMVKALLPYIKNINTMFYDVRTGPISDTHFSLLMVAVASESPYGKSEHVAVAKLLLDAGIDLNLEGLENEVNKITAMHETKSLDMSRLLLKKAYSLSGLN